MSDETQVCALPGCHKSVEQTTSGEPRRYCCTAHRKIARKRRRDNLPSRATAPITPPAETTIPAQPPAPEPPRHAVAASDTPATDTPASEPLSPPVPSPAAVQQTPPPASPAPAPPPPSSGALPANGDGGKPADRGRVVPEPKRGRFRRRDAVPYAARKARGKRPRRSDPSHSELPDWLRPASRRAASTQPTDRHEPSADAPADPIPPAWIGYAEPARPSWPSPPPRGRPAPWPFDTDSDTDTTPIRIPIPPAPERPRSAEPPRPAEPTSPAPAPAHSDADTHVDPLVLRNAKKVERAENKAARQLRKAERTAARRAEAALTRDEAAAVLTGSLLPGEEPLRAGKRRRNPIRAIEPPANGPAWAGQMYEAISAALHSLNNNRLRAILTTVGIIAGVGAVILLVALGDGMKANYNDQVEKLANQITISPVVGGVSNGAVPRFLTDSDVKALQDKEKAPDIVALSPQRVGTKITVTAGQNQDNRTILVGCTENYLRIINRHMMAGEWFSPAQITGAGGTRPAILGPQTVNIVFGFGTDPHSIIGQPIRLAHSTFRIQGVLKSDGANDDTAVVPLATARAYLVGDEGGKLDQVVVKATNAAKVQDTVDQVIDILDVQHHVRTEAGRDYDVKTYTESLKQSADFIKYLTMFVIAIAAISLFVGGVGVANIMLVSVTERTREIGIRKAVGAPRRAILRQFLSEAVVLTGLGGLAGVGLGVGLAQLGNVLIPKFVDTSDPNSQVPLPILTVSPVVIAFVVSLAIGLVAGGYPAYRAARMRPIEALRFE